MKICIGSIVGNWIAKSETFKKDGIYFNTCECICGIIRDIKTWTLNNSKTKGCGCTNTKGRFKSQAIGDLSKSYYTTFKRSRLSKGISFSDDINMEYLWDLFLNQNSKCAISGLDIFLNRHWSEQNKGRIKSNHTFQTASIDRINNSKGYEIGNIQWVHKDINYMRGGLSIEDFIFMCRKVNDNNINNEQIENNFNGKRLYFGIDKS